MKNRFRALPQWPHLRDIDIRFTPPFPFPPPPKGAQKLLARVCPPARQGRVMTVLLPQNAAEPHSCRPDAAAALPFGCVCVCVGVGLIYDLPYAGRQLPTTCLSLCCCNHRRCRRLCAPNDRLSCAILPPLQRPKMRTACLSVCVSAASLVQGRRGVVQRLTKLLAPLR